MSLGQKISQELPSKCPTVTVEHTTEHRKIPWENVNHLVTEDILENKYGKLNILSITHTDTNTEIACIEWAHFPTHRIGYIHWTHVHENYRQQGIGSTIRQTVVDTLASKVSHIYTEGYSELGIKLITSQDFEEIELDHIGRWFVYK
jgi:GNAT superfamily N-acetyltransferase